MCENAAPLLLAGANANNGANVGRFYGNWRNSASNSRWNQAALHFFPSVQKEVVCNGESAQSALLPCP